MAQKPTKSKSKKGGLGKWFGEEWTDVKTGKKCGRSSASKSKRPYPACRPKAVAGKISKSEAAKKKQGRRRSSGQQQRQGRNENEMYMWKT